MLPFLYSSGVLTLHINYFIVVIGIVIKLLNIKVNKKELDLKMLCNAIARKLSIISLSTQNCSIYNSTSLILTD